MVQTLIHLSFWLILFLRTKITTTVFNCIEMKYHCVAYFDLIELASGIRTQLLSDIKNVHITTWNLLELMDRCWWLKTTSIIFHLILCIYAYNFLHWCCWICWNETAFDNDEHTDSFMWWQFWKIGFSRLTAKIRFNGLNFLLYLLCRARKEPDCGFLSVFFYTTIFHHWKN